MKVFFIFLFSACLIFNCSVQNAGTGCDVGSCESIIAGTIYDKNGEPAKYAAVVMRPRDYLSGLPRLCKRSAASADSSYTTTTDTHGKFSFNSVSVGAYCIEAISSDENLRLLIDSIAIDQEFLESDTWIEIDTPRYDTRLKPPGTIKGVISPADDTFSGTVRVFGLDVYVIINPDGSFILDNLPQGTLRLKITTDQSGNIQNDTLIVPTIDTTGNPGAEGLNTLVRIIPVTADSNCEAGGWKKETGLDINGNDTLEDTEVTNTNYSCNEVRVLDGDYTVNSQEDLDEMVYTEITGNVTIEAPDIGNIDNFSCLTSIGGDLSIRLNTALTNLDGLSSITSVGGSLTIDSNVVLTNINGISNITSLDGDLSIYNNAALTNLDGLNGVNSVGSIHISNNDALTNLSGLSNINSVGGYGYLSISDNDALTNLDGLSGVKSVDNLRISNNDALTNIDGLSNINSVNQLNISSNDALTNIDGLSGINFFVFNLSIYSNNALTNLDGLSGITSVECGLSISDNAALTNIDGLNSINSVGEGGCKGNNNLDISSNHVLTNLDGLSGLTSVYGSLSISDNGALTNLDGLSGITSVGGGIWGGDLTIMSNQILANMTGLSNLSTLSGEYIIQDNVALPTCQAQNIADDLTNNHGYTRTIMISGNDDTGTCP